MRTDLEFEGKVAVITGAAGNIGSAAALRMSERGATIVAVDTPKANWTALKDAMPKLVAVEADVTDEDAVIGYVKRAAAETGRIDIFFNNAGIEGPSKPIIDYSLQDFESVMAVNVRGIFLGLKHVLPLMYKQRSGSVINTSSVAGLRASRGMVAYSTSKHAVIGLTRTAAAESAPHGVRVNCINPGPIEGRMIRSIYKEQSNDGVDAMDRARSRIPAGRFGTAEEVAALVAFLASDDAQFCNGGFYTIDGAVSAV